MAFMEKQTYSGRYYVVETRQGTDYVPEDVCGRLDIEPGVIIDRVDDARMGEEWDAWRDIDMALRDYVGDEIREVSVEEGELYRLSAPGYMDCTDWTTDADSPEFEDCEDEDAEEEASEPDEEDATIAPTGSLGGMTKATFGGRYLGTYASDEEALRAIRTAGNAANFWPNVWSISDHGNAHLIEGFDWDAE